MLLLALALDVRPAGPKGLGAYAPAAIEAGAFVCDYEGELLTLQQVEERYGYEAPQYLLGVEGGAFLDAAESAHASRYINHAEHGNLVVAPPGARFVAARPIAAGEELTFDYGLGYWAGRGDDPLPGTDSRVSALRRLRLRRLVAREADRLALVWSSLAAPLLVPLALSTALLGASVGDAAA